MYLYLKAVAAGSESTGTPSAPGRTTGACAREEARRDVRDVVAPRMRSPPRKLLVPLPPAHARAARHDEATHEAADLARVAAARLQHQGDARRPVVPGGWGAVRG
jgi:hypothetical protein